MARLKPGDSFPRQARPVSEFRLRYADQFPTVTDQRGEVERSEGHGCAVGAKHWHTVPWAGRVANKMAIPLDHRVYL